MLLMNASCASTACLRLKIAKSSAELQPGLMICDGETHLRNPD